MSISINNVSGFLKKNLGKTSRTTLSIRERIGLFIVGRIDGLHSLPCADDKGSWSSSTINKEISACTESHNKIYGILRINLDKKYKAVSFLLSSLEHSIQKINELTSNIPEPISEELLNTRRAGEEDINIMIVRDRRKREQEFKINKILNEINSIKRESEDDLMKLLELKSYIDQRNYEAELVCDRIRAHTKQRIDYYWNVAYRYAHKMKRVIPPVYTGIEVKDVVENYKVNYQLDDYRIAKVVSLFNNQETRVSKVVSSMSLKRD